MHQNYYFLAHLVPALKQKLGGFRISEVFVQQKDEVVVQLTNGQEVKSILCHFSSNFSCLAFPETFSRKKTNTVTIFKQINGLAIEDITVFRNERAYYISFQNEWRLVFQLFGNRSNLLLYHKQQLLDGFRKKYLDHEKPLSSFHRDQENTPKDFPALGGLSLQLFQAVEPQGTDVQTFIQTLNASSNYYIVQYNDRLRLSLLPAGQVVETFSSPVEATTQFFYQYIKKDQLTRGKSKLATLLRKQIAKTSNYIHTCEKKLSEQHIRNHKQTGDIIMANMHSITPGAKEVTLLNFYKNKEEVFKLNPELSAQKNAENYYRKSKNQHKEISNLKANIEAKKSMLINLDTQLSQLAEIDDVKEIRRLEKQPKKILKSSPFYERKFLGFRILIGKGAKQNDQLTQLHAHKNDLWLHVKDGPGSHVVIKQIPGSDFPTAVIEHAASLAAFYSKKKHDTLTPVLYTPKKFVRKRKGDPPGLVVVEKEKVVLIEPAKN